MIKWIKDKFKKKSKGRKATKEQLAKFQKDKEQTQDLLYTFFNRPYKIVEQRREPERFLVCTLCGWGHYHETACVVHLINRHKYNLRKDELEFARRMRDE